MKQQNKLAWGVSKAYLWGRSLVSLSSEDTILACYPKTGSTWIRYFLYALLQGRTHEAVGNIDEMNLVMGEFANRNLFLPWPFEEIPRIVKTHQRCLPFFRKHQSALIIRDPRDIVVSYYYYAKGNKAFKSQDSVSDVLRHPKMGMESFLIHYASWINHVGLVLKYEDLKENPLEAFSKLARFYRIERTRQQVEEAIEAASFSNMRDAQKKSRKLMNEFKKGHEFVRSGTRAQWKELFSGEDLAYCERMAEKYGFDVYD